MPYVVIMTAYRLGNKSVFCKHPSESTATLLFQILIQDDLSLQSSCHDLPAPLHFSEKNVYKISPMLTNLLYDNSAGELLVSTFAST